MEELRKNFWKTFKNYLALVFLPLVKCHSFIYDITTLYCTDTVFFLFRLEHTGVLVVAGIELVFLLVLGTVLWF